MEDCECRFELILGPSGQIVGGSIVYCSKHGAADAMYEALNHALENKYLWQIEAQAALALADKENDK